MQLSGVIKFEKFAPGTKSESIRPMLISDNGGKTLIKFNGDNPFENIIAKKYENMNITIEGIVINNNLFLVNNVII